MADDEEFDEFQEQEHEIFYDVKPSLVDLNTWRSKKTGYRELLSFCLFMNLYIIVLSMQLRVGSSYAIDSAFRSFLLDDLDQVFTQSHFWQYVVEEDPRREGRHKGIMDALLVNDWYNHKVFTSEEQGFILNYNKLVGGILIVQERGILVTDGCTELLGPSAYREFYPECFQDELDTKPFHNANTPAELMSAYEYDSERYNGYAVFLSVAEGRANNIQKVFDLQQYLWSGKATRKITIKFAFYNGNIGLFTFCSIRCRFDFGGIFLNGNHVTIQSINMEPYRSTLDYVRLFLELLFMAWASQQVVKFAKESVLLAQVRGIKALINLWTVVDAVNLSLFFAYIGFRCQVLSMVWQNPIPVPTNNYEPILEEVAAVQTRQLVVNFLNLFIGLLRFFKFYQFQERLNVLNKTFANAFTDLYHFMMMFAVIFGGYAVMAHILFGPAIKDYSSVGRSLGTCWQMVLGEFDYPAIEYVNPEMAALFFVSFMFMVLIVLVNILLAILIDAYTKATQDQEGISIFAEVGKGVIKGVNSMRGLTRDVKDHDLVAALKKLQDKGMGRVTAQQIGEVLATKTLRGHGTHDPAEIVFAHPNLVKIDVEEEEEAGGDEEAKQKEYPLELIDNIESVLRENAYLRQRVQNSEQ